MAAGLLWKAAGFVAPASGTGLVEIVIIPIPIQIEIPRKATREVLQAKSLEDLKCLNHP